MKRSLNCLLLFLGCLATFSAYSESVYIADLQLSISQESGVFGNSYSAEITGFYPDPGHTMASEPLLRRTGKEIDIDMFIVGSNFHHDDEELLVTASLVPFSRTVLLGELEDGEYEISVGYFLNGSQRVDLDQTFRIQNFAAISTVPLPASIWLMLVSLFSLSLLGRRSDR